MHTLHEQRTLRPKWGT